MNIDYADAILKLRAYLNISQEEFAKGDADIFLD